MMGAEKGAKYLTLALCVWRSAYFIITCRCGLCQLHKLDPKPRKSTQADKTKPATFAGAGFENYHSFSYLIMLLSHCWLGYAKS